jgi:hypothetical protein
MPSRLGVMCLLDRTSLSTSGSHAAPRPLRPMRQALGSHQTIFSRLSARSNSSAIGELTHVSAPELHVASADGNGQRSTGSECRAMVLRATTCRDSIANRPSAMGICRTRSPGC